MVSTVLLIGNKTEQNFFVCEPQKLLLKLANWGFGGHPVINYKRSEDGLACYNKKVVT